MASHETPATTSSAAEKTSSDEKKRPICVILLGMAGSGKSTLCGKLCEHLFAKKSMPYVVNCDPAVVSTRFPTNIDIRDTVNYKEVMKRYKLGPNGAIITCLNLFATQLDQVIQLVDKRADTHEYVLFDTPGQIEVFTWSASGAIMTEALAARFPTVIVFVLDTIRSENPITFMSNMLYSCSVVYKYKLPIIIAMNKCDAIDCKFAIDWMKDWQLFQEAIEKETSHMANLTRSMALVLDTFYENLKAVGVSATTGQGLDELMDAIKEAAVEYERDYRPEYERIKREAEIARNKQREQHIQKVNKTEELLTFGDPSATARRDRRDDSDSDSTTDHELDPVEEEEEDMISSLTTPCQCKGTAKYVHMKCLKRWLISRRTNRTGRPPKKCEICRSDYIYVYKNRTDRVLAVIDDKWQAFHHFVFNRNLQLFAMILALILCLLTVNIYYMLFTGSLDVTIHSAQLPDMDLLIWHKSDAYSIVCVDRDCDCETDIHNDNNNPNWNHECLNWKNKSVSILSKVTFLVYDADHGHDDDFIGGVSLSVYQMLIYGYNGKDVILKWDKPYAGSLAIKMNWWPKMFQLFTHFV
ncbi:unnamed protein product [Medioppia subpectinata]|uniref:GPN-loop GTPase 1 n=1 Tax=Medioppia subpectinata TaxID=1979941 RepID=A0A7R9KYD9_9ACAR|nr:unnamed protein product [Medioppia subpectinata]CAG2111813.1 unnamed protein product [Medioppia subpectinata]